MLVVCTGRSLAKRPAIAFLSGTIALKHCAAGSECLELLGLHDVDVVLAASELPDLSPTELARALRRAGFATPLLILGEVGLPTERAAALDAGVDDIVPASCETAELAARIRGLARRAMGKAEDPFRIGDLTFDPSRRRLSVGGREGFLTRQECLALELLTLRSPRLVTRDTILSSISSASPKAVDVLICRLRRKLAALGRQGLIVTVPGDGYRVAPLDRPDRHSSHG